MKIRMSDRDLEQAYDSGDFKIVQERSDFLLPQIVDFVQKDKWINIRPEYQRRLVWDKTKKSKLIESILMNIPIPPIFLYEHDLNRYEVMDGQQRLNAIVEFYSNRFKLTNLDHWEALNGKSYSDLPPRVQRGIDRRRISATVLLSESSSNNNSHELRRLVFERLNTGGQVLNPQELRNCIYNGTFNNLILELAGNRSFNEMWGIPPYEENIRGEHISKELSENRYFKRMLDCEIILRFFTFNVSPSKIKGSIKKMLDRRMEELRYSSPEIIDELRLAFTDTIDLAFEIFGKNAFCIPGSSNKLEKYSPPLFDAIMVALYRQKQFTDNFISNRREIKQHLSLKMKEDSFYALIIGRANTADSIKDRIDSMEALLLNCL
jgi:hypothetical protein